MWFHLLIFTSTVLKNQKSQSKAFVDKISTILTDAFLAVVDVEDNGVDVGSCVVDEEDCDDKRVVKVGDDEVDWLDDVYIELDFVDVSFELAFVGFSFELAFVGFSLELALVGFSFELAFVCSCWFAFVCVVPLEVDIVVFSLELGLGSQSISA